MKKIICLLLIVVGILLILNIADEEYIFKLNGQEIVNVTINDNYYEEGYIASLSGEDISSYVSIEGEIDTSKMGEYELKYTLNYSNKKSTLTRYIRVNDNIKPTLTLKGQNPVILEVGDKYEDEGAIAKDNIDEDINDKIQIIDYVDTSKVGAYIVTISVADESGNKAVVTRNVYVVEDKKKIDYLSILKDNDITYMEYTDDGIFIKGYYKDDNFDYKISLCKDEECHQFIMQKVSPYFYEGKINLSFLSNGNYTFKVNNTYLNTSLEYINRLYRGRFKDKLISFNYDNGIKINITNFRYEYDIVIDPGHGGNDTGAYNDEISEKELNLEQSLYEKKRFEEHGLNVLLLRNDSSYGIMIGPSNYQDLTRKAFAIGYYGSVAKISYSNHHNSSEAKDLSGYEILVPAMTNTKDMSLINNISSSWANSYPLLEEHKRIYTRNYQNGVIFEKGNSQMYYFNDYYAVIRIPHDLFKTNHYIFEGCYLSNIEDFNYYYKDNNWQKYSEDKIKAIVEYLEKSYIPKM